MATNDTCCSINPYFKVHDGKMEEFRGLLERFVATTQTEEKCLYYGFSINGDEVHCREGYADGDGVLAHLDNVGALLGEALKIADLTRLELHGPAAEMEKLSGPIEQLNPAVFILEYGFRK